MEEKYAISSREKMKWVLSQLADEESEFIFEKRRQYNLSKDYKYIHEIIDKYVPEFSDCKWYPDKEQEFIQAIQNSKKKVVIFGAGYYGKRVLELCKKNVTVDFFCDNDSEKWNTIIEGIITLSPEELLKQDSVGDFVIIVSPKYAYNEIIDMLLKNGIEPGHIFKFVDYAEMSLRSQYFDDKLLHFEQEEIFVDGGCFDFGTSEIFINKMEKLGGKCKKIFAFEPDEANICRCKKRIEKIGFDNADLVCGGMWSVDGYIHFSSLQNGSSHILLGEGHTDENLIQVYALDSYITEKVTFIKMDIEGAELEALKGAKNLIKKYRPKLAVCLYHKEEDIWEIPYYIKTLVPEYKLFIRHYSNYENETVLYAQCE